MGSGGTVPELFHRQSILAGCDSLLASMAQLTTARMCEPLAGAIVAIMALEGYTVAQVAGRVFLLFLFLWYYVVLFHFCFIISQNPHNSSLTDTPPNLPHEVLNPL